MKKLQESYRKKLSMSVDKMLFKEILIDKLFGADIALKRRDKVKDK